MATGGFGRGGRGAAILKHLQQQQQEQIKPGYDNKPVETAASVAPPPLMPPSSSAPTAAPMKGLAVGRGAMLAGLLQAQRAAAGQAGAPTLPPLSIPPPSISPPAVDSGPRAPASVMPTPAPAQSTPNAPMTMPIGRGRGMMALRAALQAGTAPPPQPQVAVASPVKSVSAVAPQLDVPASPRPGVMPQTLASHGSPAPSFIPAVAPPTEGMRQMNMGYQERERRQTVTMMGKDGKAIPLCANYVRVRCKNRAVYQYHVDYVPQIDSRGMRFKMLNEFRDVIGPTKEFDGFIMYLPKELPDEETVLDTKRPTDGIPVRITIRKTKVLPPEFCIQAYNTIFKRIMRMLEMCQVGRYYYNPHTPTAIPQHKLEVWPGYITSIMEQEGGLLLLADASHRVLRTETVYDVMSNLSARGRGNFKEEATKMLIGTIVLTRYNNKTYRVDDIVWDKNPTHTFPSSSTGTEISFMEYYAKNYGRQINDPQQPLLLHRPKARRLPGGEKPKETEVICLIPELCFMTGLTDDMRQDFKVMKDIAVHTRVTPAQRQMALRKFVSSVNGNPDCKQQLENWGLELEQDTLELDGRYLPIERIFWRNGKVTSAGPEADWGRDLGRSPVITAVDLNHWVVIYCKRDSSKVEDYVQSMLQVCPQMGIKVKMPNRVELRDDRNDTLINSLRDCIKPQIQVVVIVCPTSRDDRYSAIKKTVCVECPVPSQVIIARTIQNRNKLRSVTQKIALQINCKVGGELWALEIPLSNLMVIGIDVYHQVGKKSVAAFVASTNNRMTRWHSKVCFQADNQELIDGLKLCLTVSLRKYHEVNHSLPEKLVVYRDGVGDGQLRTVADYEVSQLSECFSLFGENYKPRLTVVVVQKRIDTRLFLRKGRELDNPPPGTVVDHTVTRRDWYDFFLVSQHVRQGTVSPTHYVVLRDASGMSVDHMQRLSYKMTHLYYNWPGTIRVPAPCMYAHKLAYLVGQSIHKEPSQELSDRLFFL